MNKLLLLLDRLTSTQAIPEPHVPRNTPEQIIESLSVTIKEFHHNPAEGMTFDRWFSKYEDLFSADGRELDDAAKIRLLMRSLSVPVHEKFLNYLLPRHPRDFTFEEVVKKLKSVFGLHKSQFSQRYDCLRIVKNEVDDYVTYAGIVNRQCEDFELNNLTIDQFKALIFICGLQASKDADVRTRLLSKLETDAAAMVNLETLVTECQRLSNLKHDTALVEKKQSSLSVQAVRQPKQQKLASSHHSSEKTPRTPCWQCGAMHFVKVCPFSSHLCKQCTRPDTKKVIVAVSLKQQSPKLYPNLQQKEINKKSIKVKVVINQTTSFPSTRLRHPTGSLSLYSLLANPLIYNLIVVQISLLSLFIRGRSSVHQQSPKLLIGQTQLRVLLYL
ncbi:uncharacterized protein LOC131434084 [Malaya genurostris]|uniref:uncharacterized protein LOC131434084 n=1 Tax=Malaya genurostris TaxID=325434 RepID=UPI0026F39D29|nr:uncharacterized protein LOC131434084 [Malaya genurostris]